MKVSVEINLPIDQVVEMFMDKRNFKAWKKDFISYEHTLGIPGEVGSITKLAGKRGAMFETIISKNLPGEIIETYEHRHGGKTIMVHKAINRFISSAGKKTVFEVETELTLINGFLLKLIMKLMAGAGKRYSQDQLNSFKAFAESTGLTKDNVLDG